MAFEVRWRREAIESITRIFDGSEDQGQIDAAIRQLDRDLSFDPGTRGESRPAGRRIVFAPPLAALIEIHWRLNAVVIAEIWEFE